MRALSWIAIIVGSLIIFPAQAGPKFEKWTTKSGLRVVYVGIRDLQMLDVTLGFDAGSARDEKRPGLSFMTMNMLNKGAAGKNANQIAEMFESVGANFYTNASRDKVEIGLRTITLEPAFTTALEGWLDVVEMPDFPLPDLERLKKQMQVSFEAAKQQPSRIAGRAFYENLYGDHPYASPTRGTEESVATMTPELLQSFYERFIVEENALLTIVGNVSRERAEELAEQVAEILPAGKKPAPIPPVKPLTASKTVYIPFPSAQSHVFIGQTGTKRGDPDYFTLYLANHPFGGSSFTSRLVKEIRVKKGLSYSVYSYFSPSKEYGPFVIGLQTRADQVDEAVKTVNEMLREYRENGPTADELESSKLNVIGGFPMSIANNSSIASYADVIGFFDLPLDYLDRFPGEIEAVTAEQIKDALKRRVNPDALLTVIVGGKEKKDKQASK